MFPEVKERKAEIGVFGGSGLYNIEGATVLEEIKVETPFGMPSDLITIVEIAGKRVAFLPRHGRKHQYPPHKIPYKANIWAMKSLGVERILAPNAVGSLQRHIKPGDLSFATSSLTEPDTVMTLSLTVPSQPMSALLTLIALS